MSPSRSAPSAGDRPQHGRLGAGEEDGDAQQVGVGHPCYSASHSRIASQPSGPSTIRSDSSAQLRRRLRRDDADADRRLQLALLAQLAQAAEGVEVGAVVAGVDGGARAVAGEQRGDRGVLAAAADRPQLQHLAAPARFEPGLPAATAISWARASARPLVLGAAPVQGLDRPLVLEPQPGPVELSGVERRR